jgi:Icc-related predicted phosphoesterase
VADVRLFFATDIHGSERCFKKFLNAARFYRCDVLVMGGDMTGKMVLPVVHDGNGRWSARLGGREQVVDADGLAGLRALIANAGYYAYETSAEEVRALEADPGAVDTLFERLMRETLGRWLALAEERLNGSDTICVLAPGNDDPPFVDDVLASSPRVINPEHRVVELPGGFRMISCGTSNRTPWDTPREASEEELAEMIEREAAALADFDRAIFNLHVPPKDTPIDQAMLLDGELRPIMQSGSPVIGGVGSSAVRAAIERHQPLLSLHGHIHESRGEARIGRTVALNPGSEYGEGVLRGVIVTLSTKRGLKGHQFVAG